MDSSHSLAKKSFPAIAGAATLQGDLDGIDWYFALASADLTPHTFPNPKIST